MVNKIRLKDITKELGIGNKELLQILRELGIQVKSQMGTLTDEEAGQVRARVRQGQAARTQIIDTEVQPGVIVRRRKAAPTPPPAPPATEKAPESATPPAAPGPEVEEPLERVAEQAAGETPEARPEEAAEAPREASGKPVIMETARVVRPAGAPAPEAPEVEAAAPEEPEVPETPEAEVEVEERQAASASETTEAVAETPEAPEATAGETPAEAQEASKAPEEAAAEPGEKDRRKPRRPEPSSAPKVRIISMPDPKKTPPPAPRRPAGEAPRPGSRPGPGGRPGPGAPRFGEGPRPAGRPVPGMPPAPGDDASKKRKKDRRVVEFSPQATEDQRRRAGLGAGKGGKRNAGDVQDRTGGRMGGKFKRKKNRDDFLQTKVDAGAQPMKAAKRKIRMEETIRVSDLAKQMGAKAQDLIKVLLGLGALVTINQSLDVETATLAASEFGFEVEKFGFSEDDYLIASEADKPEDLRPRPPVVTIMGHVDHGKTSLLDAIRASNVVSGEAGGITQHIGAYHVSTSRGDIVFLDTPGHEAFTAMRARGAQVTDIVVLVVAADDGVMDQTREAVNHSKAAGVPIVVAVNKIDKPDANPDRVKRELGELGLVPEDWGGDTIFANVSAKQKLGLDELLEMILLQAEVLQLKANPDKRARGHIVEARLDKGRGPVASVLIQEGTLHQGDAFVCGVFSGRVRAMFDDQGHKIKEAGPAIPVEVQGFEGVPEAGDEFVGVEDDKVARRIADDRAIKQRERELGKASKVTLETFLASRPEAEALTLNLVLKADVQGSLEAITDALNKLSTDKVKVEIIHTGAGAITESDILLASASDAIIIGFNVRPTIKVKEMAERESVDIRFYDIIYKLVGEIKDAMSGMLAPVIREQYLGQAEVRDTFSVPKVGTVAGCGVLDGKLTRNAGVRLVRDGVVVYTGKLASLRRFKDDVKEVTKGYECGVGLENFNDIKVGDVIEAFESVEEKATL
ncbi:translation initiation factor IF-2 [Solidesulfovibrio fructosivorans JJ]]|uniref:Translation initiation factor IF-2 n=1 Tax=Solidesulfovibrio fructosivorans JJ] TaxID=596151 RepID=E1JZD3_SOLFR|nr:translation initiation factor IF-2 [Solidesulfovibrio fructosivorans]EFL50293.1 translation initiation factor IF-2 [Solidesulfovibrio fructosivorans JJ]]